MPTNDHSADGAEPTNTVQAPLLPPASVDFNALHDACRANASPEAAREKAVVLETVALSADEARAASVGGAVTGEEPGDELDDRGMTIPKPQEIARLEHAEFESDANKPALKAAIRANRIARAALSGSPAVPPTPTDAA